MAAFIVNTLDKHTTDEHLVDNAIDRLVWEFVESPQKFEPKKVISHKSKVISGDVQTVESSPVVETPKVETPKVETPKVETPKVETPKVETPKVETPKVETPKVETPKVETPKVEESNEVKPWEKVYDKKPRVIPDSIKGTSLEPHFKKLKLYTKGYKIRVYLNPEYISVAKQVYNFPNGMPTAYDHAYYNVVKDYFEKDPRYPGVGGFSERFDKFLLPPIREAFAIPEFDKIAISAKSVWSDKITNYFIEAEKLSKIDGDVKDITESAKYLFDEDPSLIDSYIGLQPSKRKLTAYGNIFYNIKEKDSIQYVLNDKPVDVSDIVELLKKNGEMPSHEIITIEGVEVPVENRVAGTSYEEYIPFEESKSKPAWGANNKIVSTSEYEKAKERLSKKLNRMNMGFDPEIMSDGIIMAAYHLEAGVRSFSDYSKKMIEDLGENVKPYLKAFYNGARDMPGMEDIAKEMTTTEDVAKFDIESLGENENAKSIEKKEVNDEPQRVDITEQIVKTKPHSNGRSKVLLALPDGKYSVFGHEFDKVTYTRDVYDESNPRRTTEESTFIVDGKTVKISEFVEKHVDVYQKESEKVETPVEENNEVKPQEKADSKPEQTEEEIANDFWDEGIDNAFSDLKVWDKKGRRLYFNREFANAVGDKHNIDTKPYRTAYYDLDDKIIKQGRSKLSLSNNVSEIFKQEVEKRLKEGNITDSQPKEDKNVSSTTGILERSGRNGNIENTANEEVVLNGERGLGRVSEQPGQQTNGSGVRQSSGVNVPGDNVRTTGTPGAGVATGQVSVSDRVSTEDNGHRGRSGDSVLAEQTEVSDRGGSQGVRETNNGSNDSNSSRSSTSIKLCDRDNIADTLPELFKEQQDDVYKAEKRYLSGKGMLFTNGTGTGKTFTGLGIIKRFHLSGKKNILVVTPSDTKNKDWSKDAKLLDLKVNVLKNTKDNGGDNIVVTTYANFAVNQALLDRNWDLIVCDESHKLCASNNGKVTKALDNLRNLCGIKQHNLKRAILDNISEFAKAAKAANIFASYDFSKAKIKTLGGIATCFDDYKKNLPQQLVDKIENRAKEIDSKVLFLSATPFSYHVSLQYADELLFDTKDYKEDSRIDRWGHFLIDNFGYRYRQGKLTKPDSSADLTYLERDFFEKLRKSGAVSGRVLDVDKDYSREFFKVRSELGEKIQRGYDIITSERDYPILSNIIKEKFNYNYVTSLLECLKVKAVINEIKKDLALGRKVVVFHNRTHGLPPHPFDFTQDIALATDSDEKEALLKEIDKFKTENPDLANLKLNDLKNPIDTFKKEFGDNVVFFNGTVSKSTREKGVDVFNKKGSNKDIILVQIEAGKEGISLHDRTGDSQRVLYNLGLPTKPTDLIQSEGRIYRLLVKSNAIFRYPVTKLAYEQIAFGSRINERAGTAENLAMGYMARDLRSSLRDAYLNAGESLPPEQQGVGGKDFDHNYDKIDEYEKAKTYYYTQQKKNSSTKSAEGVDYYATPEPLGYKMVQWAKLSKGERVLEPSAGHGAIARFFPENVNAFAIEPSYELMSKLSVTTTASVERSTFEDLHIMNKYHAIVMNPPFGSGGSTAIEHLEKAVSHLYETGRIVAIIPEGPACDKKFEKFMNDENSKNIQLTAEYGLPNVTFSRAGTNVKCRVVILDKIPMEYEGYGKWRYDDNYKIPVPKQKIDIDAKSIEEFFDKIKDRNVPDRIKEKVKENNNVKLYSLRDRGNKKFNYFPGDFNEFWKTIKTTAKNVLVKRIVSPVTPLIADFLNQNNINVDTEFNHVMDNFAIAHVIKEHGSVTTEEKRGQIPVNKSDLSKAEDIVNNFDKIGINSRNGKPVIIYAKHYPDNTTIYLEEIRTGRGELALKTMYKKKGSIPNDLLQILTDAENLNAQSDSDLLPSNDNISDNAENASDYIHYSLVRNKELLRKLNEAEKSGEYITAYRSMQIGDDGLLHSPMAAKTRDENNKLQWTEGYSFDKKNGKVGVWEQADERPELVYFDDKKDPEHKKPLFTLNKGKDTDNKEKKLDDIAYNPYIHSSNTPLNDQFTSAYKRPNLVTVEVHIPKFDLESGYHAQYAKDPVGTMNWHKGTIAAQLNGDKTRKVNLSRYNKIVRIIPDNEVAQMIKENLTGTDIVIPRKLVTPSLYEELQNAGVPTLDNMHYSLKRRKQVNPILDTNSENWQYYQDMLDNSHYETQSNAKLNKEAAKLIAEMGGTQKVIQAMLKGKYLNIDAVHQRAAWNIVNDSEAFANLKPAQQTRIFELYMEDLGTTAGQALAARRMKPLDYSDIESIQSHVNVFLAKILKTKSIDGLRKDVLDRFNIDLLDIPEDIVTNPYKLDALLKHLATEKATLGDKFYEFWINSILSGPATHAANIIGNTANMVYELGIKRFAEACINSALKRKDSATFGEFKAIVKAVNWRSAFNKAKFAFDLEMVNSNNKLDNAFIAIDGKAGEFIRTPSRLLKAADEFAKAIIAPIEAVTYAYRQGRQGGLKGESLQQFMEEQLYAKNSEAREYARDRALEISFQGKPGFAVEKLIQWKNSGGLSGTLLKYLLPFMRTPANILKQGFMKSPLGIAQLAYEGVQVARGKQQFDNKMVGHIAEQIIAWGAVMAFMGLGDDDDDNMPFITGSSSQYGSAEQRFKANKIPPYSIRFGGTYYSYQRIEPLATGLSFIADGINALNAAKSGEDGTKILKRLVNGTGKMIAEKSFLDTIGEISRIAADPERSTMRFFTNFAASWVPNVYKQTRNAFDDNVRDNKSYAKGQQWWRDQFNVITNSMGITVAAPRYDYFGREITKDALSETGGLGKLLRLIPIKAVNPDENMNKADLLMWRYNQTHLDEQYYPGMPSYYFKHNGKKLYFEGENYSQYVHDAGQLALKQVNNAFKHGLLNVNNPTKADVDLIKKIFAKSRKLVREIMVEKRLYSE